MGKSFIRFVFACSARAERRSAYIANSINPSLLEKAFLSFLSLMSLSRCLYICFASSHACNFNHRTRYAISACSNGKRKKVHT